MYFFVSFWRASASTFDGGLTKNCGPKCAVQAKKVYSLAIPHYKFHPACERLSNLHPKQRLVLHAMLWTVLNHDRQPVRNRLHWPLL